MNLPKRIKWSFKGSLTSKQMSRGKKYFGWENYPVEFVSNKFKQERITVILVTYKKNVPWQKFMSISPLKGNNGYSFKATQPLHENTIKESEICVVS